MKRIALALMTILALSASALAQWQVPNNSVPIGRGSGIVGFNSVPPGVNNNCLVSNGTVWSAVICPGSTFTQSGSGAVTRTMQDKARDIVSILDFGGDSTGTNDNATAYSNAIASLPTTGGTVYFPKGRYKFSTAVNFSFTNNASNLTLKGDGIDSTVLTWPNAAGGFGFIYNNVNNSVHIRDMSLTTQQTNGGTAITLFLNLINPSPGMNSLSEIANVVFRGDDGIGQTDYWSFGVSANQVSNINITNSQFYGSSTQQGVGAYHVGALGNTTVVFNIAGCFFGYLNQAVYIGTYEQGISITDTNFVLNNIGIYQPAGNISNAELTIATSEFDNKQFDIDLETGLVGVQIGSSYFISESNSTGIRIVGIYNFSITGNYFEAETHTSTVGIQIGSNGSGTGIITANDFNNHVIGIKLEAGSTNLNIQGNTFQSNVLAAISNVGTGTHNIASNINGGAANNISVGTTVNSVPCSIYNTQFVGTGFYACTGSAFAFLFHLPNGTAEIGLDTSGNWVPATTNTISLGQSGFNWTNVFSRSYAIVGSGSGTVTQTAQAAAGTPTVTWGTATGTPAVTATTPLVINSTTGNLTINGFSNTAPTISSGCGGGSPSISAPNGTVAFRVTIGTASGSTCVLTMPTATTGWNCFAQHAVGANISTVNFGVLQTASTNAQVTLTNYSDIAGAATWVNGDILAVNCASY